MKKVIAYIDDAGNLVDENGQVIWQEISNSTYKLKDFEEETKPCPETVEKLTSMGVGVDGILRLRANKLI